MSSAECAVCGMRPVGTGCYNICPNSVAYYSPEQERADEANYGADRWEGWGDPDLDASEDPRGVGL